jgi:hypothetical protein
LGVVLSHPSQRGKDQARIDVIRTKASTKVQWFLD